MIEFQCGLGDHRRCTPPSCVVAARWHEPMRRAGVAAARSAGSTWAVVTTSDHDVVVLGTENNLARAVLLLRTGAPNPTDASIGSEPVYVVRGSDGGLF